MSSHIWTRGEVSSNFKRFEEEAWRVVEAQHLAATMKLTETLEEQAMLETLLERTKPLVPEPCKGLHFLLAAPFRYKPYPHGSRFRRAGQTPGVFYCSANSTTAVAEMAFYRTLFFAESPQTPWPTNPCEYTVFSVPFGATRGIDLAAPPFDLSRSEWEDPVDYAACQEMEALCREAGAHVISYRSVRDPDQGVNFAILSCAVFTSPTPARMESWKMHLGPGGARAVREFPPFSLAFPQSAFAADPRIAGLRWTRVPGARSG